MITYWFVLLPALFSLLSLVTAVRFELPRYSNANGTAQPDCLDNQVVGWGDNHCAYMGFRQLAPMNNLLRDDGAVNVVVAEWKTSSEPKTG